MAIHHVNPALQSKSHQLWHFTHTLWWHQCPQNCLLVWCEMFDCHVLKLCNVRVSKQLVGSSNCLIVSCLECGFWRSLFAQSSVESLPVLRVYSIMAWNDVAITLHATTTATAAAANPKSFTTCGCCRSSRKVFNRTKAA